MQKLVIVLICIIVLLMGCTGSQLPEDSSDNVDDVIARAQQFIEDTLAVDSSIPQLLEALGVAQQVGLSEYEPKLMDRIKVKIEMQLADPGLCKQKLLDIIQLAQQLGFSDIEGKANSRLSTALVSCDGTAGESSVRYNYEFVSDPKAEIGTRKVKITASVTGTLKEWTVLGVSAEGQDSFYFEDGQLTWSWDDYSESGCEITTVKGRGIKQLTSSADGSLTLLADGTYSGYIIRAEVPVIVGTKTKSAELYDDDGDPKTPLVNRCSYVQEESHSETQQIEVELEDKTEDLTHIVGVSQKTETHEEIGGTTLSDAVWNLLLPK